MGAGVWLWATYAATSVGRGWDSVGHTPGTYAGRLRLIPLVPPRAEEVR